MQSVRSISSGQRGKTIGQLFANFPKGIGCSRQIGHLCISTVVVLFARELSIASGRWPEGIYTLWSCCHRLRDSVKNLKFKNYLQKKLREKFNTKNYAVRRHLPLTNDLQEPPDHTLPSFLRQSLSVSLTAHSSEVYVQGSLVTSF